MVRADATLFSYVWFCLLVHMYVYLAKKSDIFRCIGSNRDKIGFCAEIQRLFWDSALGDAEVTLPNYFVNKGREHW